MVSRLCASGNVTRRSSGKNARECGLPERFASSPPPDCGLGPLRTDEPTSPVAKQRKPFALAARLASMAILMPLVMSCAGMPPQAEQMQLASSPEAGVVAFGRVRWINNDVERFEYKTVLGWNIWPQLLRLEDGKTKALGVEKRGTFVWRLPVGTYLLHQVQWFDPWDGPHRLEPKVAFQLGNEKQAHCLGTMTIDLTSSRDLIGGLRIQSFKVEIMDDCNQQSQAFSARASNRDIEISKALMVHGAAIPTRPSDLERKDQVFDILRALIPGLMTIR